MTRDRIAIAIGMIGLVVLFAEMLFVSLTPQP